MKRLLVMLVVVASGLVAVPAAQAAAPNFAKASAAIAGDNSGNLVCTFKQVGLGKTPTSESVSCSAASTVTYTCDGGATTFQGTALVTAMNSFPVRNGSVSGSVTIPSTQPFRPICNGAGDAQALAVTYTDVTIHTANATANVPGVFSHSF